MKKRWGMKKRWRRWRIDLDIQNIFASPLVICRRIIVGLNRWIILSTIILVLTYIIGLMVNGICGLEKKKR
jgi:hypothetical protein